MIRIIVKELASDPSGATHTAWKTFDVSLPEVEDFLDTKVGYYGSGSRFVVGAEIIHEAKP